jgi:NAD+ diphosphatase
MKFKFCPKCGKELVLRQSWDEGEVPYCPVDNIMYFETPKPCIVVAVIKGKKILLLKQSYTFKNSKILVSGYVTNGENVEQTVIREVEEETGIVVGDIQYLGSEYLDNKELLMLTFMAKYKDGYINKSKEVELIEWVDLELALEEMKEDKVGSAVVSKILKLKLKK